MSLARSRYGAFTAMNLWLIAIATGCVQARQPHLTETKMSASTSTDSRTTAHDAELVAHLDYDASARVVVIRYNISNTHSKSALAVFDRADSFAVSQGQQALGDVAVPHQTADGSDITLWHAVQPTSFETESVPSPAAMRLAPGASLTGEFTFGLLGAVSPKRLRWCVGVMPFDEKLFGSPATIEAGEVWVASSAVIEFQQTLCTRWYDVDSRAFVDDSSR